MESCSKSLLSNKSAESVSPQKSRVRPRARERIFKLELHTHCMNEREGSTEHMMFYYCCAIIPGNGWFIDCKGRSMCISLYICTRLQLMHFARGVFCCSAAMNWGISLVSTDKYTHHTTQPAIAQTQFLNSKKQCCHVHVYRGKGNYYTCRLHL